MGGGPTEKIATIPAVESAPPKKKSTGRDRFPFIDQFRGLIGIMMALGHSSGYFNGAWKSLDMFDPLFNSAGQFGLRYMGYLCAPGFLMMNGAVSWFSYTRRRAVGGDRLAGEVASDPARSLPDPDADHLGQHGLGRLPPRPVQDRPHRDHLHHRDLDVPAGPDS